MVNHNLEGSIYAIRWMIIEFYFKSFSIILLIKFSNGLISLERVTQFSRYFACSIWTFWTCWVGVDRLNLTLNWLKSSTTDIDSLLWMTQSIWDDPRLPKESINYELFLTLDKGFMFHSTCAYITKVLV